MSRRSTRAVVATFAAALALSSAALAQVSGDGPECVVLLHGLARTSASMRPLERALADAGFSVANVDYPSREAPIESLAPLAVGEGLARCSRQSAQVVHFVTHSLGGILVRFYLFEHEIPSLGRVVMLAPPNQGSEAVDALAATPGFDLLNGPAGYQLGTGDDSIPRRLGPANFEVGIITGDRTINLILSGYLPNPDDGKVSVESAKLEGMTDFLVVHEAHPFIMRSQAVMRQVIHFLREGRFDPAGED